MRSLYSLLDWPCQWCKAAAIARVVVNEGSTEFVKKGLAKLF
jgi:hypothetical protein